MFGLEQQWIRLSGKLVYDPKRDFVKADGKHVEFKKAAYKSRTLIAELPRDDISALYRWFLFKNKGIRLQPPMYAPHVTIVRGNEKVPNMSAWKKHVGKRVDIYLSPVPYAAWKFWALDVKPTDELSALRHELGITASHNYHLTIGREYEPEDLPAPRPEIVLPYSHLKVAS